MLHGGPAGVRTLDLGIKSPLLYQLSYRSLFNCNGVGEGVRTLDLRSHGPSLFQLSYTHHVTHLVQLVYYCKTRQ